MFVALPEPMAGQLRVVTYPAPGGTGGVGGRPGRGGKGGRNADPPQWRPPDGGRAARPAGAPGKAGRGGVGRPAPEVFVNGKPFEGRTTSQ